MKDFLINISGGVTGIFLGVVLLIIFWRITDGEWLFDWMNRLEAKLTRSN